LLKGTPRAVPDNFQHSLQATYYLVNNVYKGFTFSFINLLSHHKNADMTLYLIRTNLPLRMIYLIYFKEISRFTIFVVH
jgi:hypothetical protein